IGVLHQRAQRRAAVVHRAAVVLRIGHRPSVAARVPGEHRDVRQIQLIHHVLQPPRVFMPAMKQNDGAFGAPPVGRPISVEQARAIRGAEMLLLWNPHNYSLILRSVSPPRTRLTMVKLNSRASRRGNPKAPQPGTVPPAPIHNASAPKTKARSLFPIGP